jgi:hypothetical protein
MRLRPWLREEEAGMEIRLSYVEAVRNTRWMLERASNGSTVHVVRPGEDGEVVMMSGAEYRRLVEDWDSPQANS